MRFDQSTLPDVSGHVVGILGGTGDQGRGLAIRLAQAGQRVLIGSRNAERAEASAKEIAAIAGGDVRGAENASVARDSDLIIIAVPFDGHASTLESLKADLAGKIVIDCVNPLGFGKQG